MATVRWLDEQESDAWRAVRDLGQPLWTVLGRDLQSRSGLSMADYHVLVQLSAQPDGTLGYRELIEATGWEKSRLSHQLTRMERRELLWRRECLDDARSADIILTATGRAAIEQAAPGHLAAVRRLLIDLLSADEVRTLADIGRRVRAAMEAEAAAAG